MPHSDLDHFVIRKLWPGDFAAFRRHLKRLDPESRKLRFGMAVNDDFLAAYADTANTIRVPAHTVADGVVEYGVNAHLSLRLNINNLTDTVYVKSVNNNGGRYNPGERRSVLATTTVRF